MLYSEYLIKSKELVIVKDEITGLAYLSPDYRVILIDNELTPDVISNYELSWQDIREILDLEVTRFNTERDYTKVVIDWLYDTITAVIDPAISKEQSELIQNVMSYMELNSSLKDRERDIEKKEKIVQEKHNIVDIMPGVNFSKRK